MSENAMLAAAVGAALSAVGWPAVRLLSERRLANAVHDSARIGRLVLLADAHGRLPDPRPALAGRATPVVVAVGTRAALSALADAVERLVAVTALDAEQPFADLIEALDRLLRLESPLPDRTALVAALRRREHEARRFEELTPREQEMLGALMGGVAATDIAAASHVSMATVRSHIRAVLTKLGVSSQLAAVALTHRACREPGVVAQMRQVHQF